MVLALIVSGLLAAGPAAVETPAAPAAAPAARGPVYAPAKAADQKDDQFVCHTEAVLGSRLPVRRCRTVGDIKDHTLQDRQQLEHAQQNLQWRSN